MIEARPALDVARYALIGAHPHLDAGHLAVIEHTPLTIWSTSPGFERNHIAIGDSAGSGGHRQAGLGLRRAA